MAMAWPGCMQQQTFSLSSVPALVSGPWSCRPQPLGSGGDATPCEDPRQEHGPVVQVRSRVSFNGYST